MCLQCTSKAVLLFADLLPGFSLMQATQDSTGWKTGQYGLVECNDPTVVFDGPLVADPTAGMTDDEINAISAPVEAALAQYLEAAERLGNQLVVDASTGYRLVSACISKGYRLDEDGAVEFWLMRHMATQLQSATAHPAV